MLVRVFSWMKSGPVKFLFLCFLVFHSLWSFRQGSSNDLRKSDARMLEVASITANALFYGVGSWIENFSEVPIDKSVIEKCSAHASHEDFSNVAQARAFNSFSNAKLDLMHASIVGGNVAYISYVVSGDGPLWLKSLPAVVTVAIKYSVDYGRSGFDEYIHQFMNVGYLPDLIRSNSSGDWHFLSGSYSYCASDYLLGVKSMDPDAVGRGGLSHGISDADFAAALEKAAAARDRVISEIPVRISINLSQVVDELRASKNLPPLNKSAGVLSEK